MTLGLRALLEQLLNRLERLFVNHPGFAGGSNS